MSAREIVAFILQLMGILTAWPVILLVVILVFRLEICQLLQRLKSAKIGDGSIEFADEVKAMQYAVKSGVENSKASLMK